MKYFQKREKNMILKKQCLLIGIIILLCKVQGRELPIEGAPLNDQSYLGRNGEMDKSQYRSQHRDLDNNSRVLKSQGENAFENQNRHHRREAVSNYDYDDYGYNTVSSNDEIVLQFDNKGSSAEITIAFNQNFTVCFAFMIDKLAADISEENVFQWQ